MLCFFLEVHILISGERPGASMQLCPSLSPQAGFCGVTDPSQVCGLEILIFLPYF